MPRRRRYNNKRPFTKAQYRAVAKVANKQVHKLSELHTIDESPISKAMTLLSAETPVVIKFPVQGDGSDQRIGDSIYLRSVNFRCLLQNELDVDLVSRVVFFQWMEPASDPVVGDLFADTSKLTSPYVVNPTKRFKIMHDSMHVWDSNANSKGNRYMNLSFKGKSFKIHKPDFEADATEVATGRIWYIIASNVADIGQIDQIYTRVRYFDN